MTPDPWDDDRLAAAFAARAATAPTPNDLVATTVRTVRASRSKAGRSPLWWLLPAAAVVAVAVILARPQPLASPVGQTPTTTPTVQPSASASPDPQIDSVFGIPVITVEAAIALRDGGGDDREIAVRGWFASVAVPCPSLRPEPPFGLTCPDEFRWLTASAWQPDSNGPLGPSIRPVIESGILAPPTATELVLVGHFHDRREPASEWFIVDGIAFGNVASGPDPAVAREVETTQIEADDVATMVRAASPTGWVMWMVAYGPGQIVVHEPSIANRRGGERFGSVVWRVGVLEDGYVVTYLVEDDTASVYRVVRDGSVVRVRDGSPVDPVWPPASATVITLESPTGASRPPVEVAVVDASDHVTSVAEAHADGIPTSVIPAEPVDVWLAIDPTDARRVYVGWTGGVCDSHATITVGVDVGTITFDGGPHTPCDGMAIERAVVLTFDAPLAVPPSLLVSMMSDGTSESPG